MSIGQIESLEVRFGARQGSGLTNIDLGPVTVLVGPNNGGKSRTLTDLRDYAARATRTRSPTGTEG